MTTLLLSLLSACRTATPAGLAPASRIDRLINAYPELRAGRFALIADFEDAHHLELFDIGNASGEAGIAPIETDSRTAGSGTALQFHAGSDADEVIVNNDHAADWYLKRDWRDFDVLLLAADAPRADLELQVTVQAGPPGHEARARAAWPLHRGQNVVRLDLAELGEQVPLDDIREVSVGLSGLARPIDVTLDDLILTQDRAVIVGDRSSTDGSLYVSRVGRRWLVGAGGRFELVFANGQIVAWYELAGDPLRLHNLASGTALGPEVIFENEQAFGADEAPIASASVRTELVEANAVRAIIDVERRVGDPEHTSGRWREQTQWRYTIYPTGQVFVGVESVPSGRQAARRFSLAVSLHHPDVQTTRTISTAATDGPDTERTPIGIVTKPRASDAALLFVPYFGAVPQTFETKPHADGAVTYTATPSDATPAGDNRTCAAALLWVTRTDTLSDAAADHEANWFRKPRPPALLVGEAKPPDDPCTFADAGFVRARGAYVVEPDRSLVRLKPSTTSNGVARGYEVYGVGGRKAWVYVGQRLFEPTANDADGAVIFQLPAGTPEAATVEVLLANP